MPVQRLKKHSANGFTRREMLLGSLVAIVCPLAAVRLYRSCSGRIRTARTFIAKVEDYSSDIAVAVFSGMKEIGVSENEVKGKKILLKPNIVEPSADAHHINTHPAVVRGVAEAFFKMGAASVVVGEGSGHCRDTLRILEVSGLADVLVEDRIPFIDLNADDVYPAENLGGYTKLKTLYFPKAVDQADWVVSIPKMKTHHWAGVTLSMKNLFGVMPGRYYGWPKNVLHYEGIFPSIVDIAATLKPHFTVVDGIVGMEGDGPIMGEPKPLGAIIVGRNLPAVDATCARLMGIQPEKIDYLAVASGKYGPITENAILQVGEPISALKSNFKLINSIPAHNRLLNI